MTYEEWQLQENGYQCITTFWTDFSIADKFGIDAIKDTFKRAFADWKSDYKYLTELVLALNHKCHWHYGKKDFEKSQLYHDLYFEARNYALDNLKGEEFEYYYRITD